MPDYVSAGDRPVIVKARNGWTTGELVAWHRGAAGWVGQVNWRTGAPVWSSRQYWLPAAQVTDSEPCTDCPVLRAKFLRERLDTTTRP